MQVPLKEGSAYRKLEAGERWPTWETYDRIAAAFGWPRTVAGMSTQPHESSRGA